MNISCGGKLQKYYKRIMVKNYRFQAAECFLNHLNGIVFSKVTTHGILSIFHDEVKERLPYCVALLKIIKVRLIHYRVVSRTRFFAVDGSGSYRRLEN